MRALALGALALATFACTSSAPSPTPTPSQTPTATQASPPTETASAGPTATASPPAAPTPELGIPFHLEPLEVEARLVPDGDPEGVGGPFVVDLQTREAMRWARAGPFVALSPFDDRVLGVVYGQPSGLGEAYQTILLDLATGETEGLLPVAASVLRWLEADRVFLLIDPLTFGHPRSWPPGIYELDLEARTIELVSRGGGARELSPDGTMTLASSFDVAPGIVVRDVADGESIYSYLAKDESGAEPIRLWSAVWLEDGRVAITLEDRRLVVIELRTGVEVVYRSDDRAPYPASLSPDGRTIAVVLTSGEYAVDLRQDTVLLDAATLEVVAGPLENSTPLRWSSDSRSLIMRGGACGPDGDWVEVLDVASDISRRIAPGVDGLFYLEASNDASKVAGGVWEDWVLIDVAGGQVEALPALGTRTVAPPYISDVPSALRFSASGRWLVANVDLGGEGC